MITLYADEMIAATADQDLAERVMLFLQLKRPELADLMVTADGGEVRLRGCVDSYYLRQLAISITKRVAGVVRVIDRIEVLDHPIQVLSHWQRSSK
jgi:osmotically-inducible protein OsmY